MAFRTGGFLAVTLLIATHALAQSTTPRLNKSQRELLQAIVAAVDAAAAAPETAGLPWQTHVLRTSDGSHYVAFSLEPPLSQVPAGPTTLYVRLATRRDASSTDSERSAVMEWLKGMRSEPLVAQKRRGIAFGEMPTFGAGAIAARGPGQQSSDLALLSMERERARERREAAEKERRDALEGNATRARDAIYPFEDFAVDRVLTADMAARTRRIQRSVTAAPGEYDLYVAWAGTARKGQAPAIHIAKRSLRLAPTPLTELALSSVIVADAVGTRDVPHPPDQQSSHPYAIGPLEIVPAPDETFTNDERLTLVFQVMHARGDAAGKPDVAISFQLFRAAPGGEQFVGSLNPQVYNGTTLPADFDVKQGHPLFVAMAAPLKTLPRGDYRLRIAAADKLAARSTAADLSFRIVATPQTLLAGAPKAPGFDREQVLGHDVLRDVAARLRPTDPSAAMTVALDAARDRRFIELLRDDAVRESEQGARAALKGIGLYALGDARIACTILRQSMQAAANAATLLYLGACRALEKNDADAIAAWQEALDGNLAAPIALPLLAGAHLRLGNVERAADLAERLVVNGVAAPAIVPALATAYIAQGREADALRILEPHVAADVNDLEAQYVLLHALFAGFVRGQGVGATPDGQARLRALGRSYIGAKGRHAAVVSEWLEILP